jgi:hypothetical protein
MQCKSSVVTELKWCCVASARLAYAINAIYPLNLADHRSTAQVTTRSTSTRGKLHPRRPSGRLLWSIALYDNDGFQVANQLPYNLTMRIYAPEADALTGKWNPLPVMKAQTVPAAAQ